MIENIAVRMTNIDFSPGTPVFLPHHSQLIASGLVLCIKYGPHRGFYAFGPMSWAAPCDEQSIIAEGLCNNSLVLGGGRGAEKLDGGIR